MTTASQHPARPAIVAACLLLVYLLLVLLPFDAGILLACCVAACFAVVWLLGRLGKRGVISRGQFGNITASCTAILLSLLAMDVIYTAFDIHRQGVSFDESQVEVRQKTDSGLNASRLIPPTWYPGSGNFFLFKPGVSQSGTGYGSFYDATMLASPLLRNEVLELHALDYHIDENGFREQTPLADASIFCLGDSYAFGHNNSQNSNWVEVLEQHVGKPVYNLGMPATSPAQQLQLLRYVLERHKPGIKHLLWMIFEGNDLTDSYATANPLQAGQDSVAKKIFKQTLLGEPYYVVKKLRAQSVLNRLFNDGLVFTWPGKAGSGKDPFVTEGVRTRYPLYHSARFGARMFRNFYTEVAGYTEEFIEQHPNHARLQQVFTDMAGLADSYGFDVTVLIAPTAARLHARDFEDFPEISEQPHFINLVSRMAAAEGFAVLDLHERLQPHARQELLYWRDDDHWNARGNELVAGIVAGSIFK